MRKHTVSRRCSLRLLAFAVLLAFVSRAAEMNIPYLKCDITLSKNTITPGEPLSLCFTFTNTSDGEVSVSFDDMYNTWEPNVENRLQTENLKIVVKDLEGNRIPRRNLLCRPHSQFYVFSTHLKPNETITQEYPLHLRTSTLLKPGQYLFEIESFDLNHCHLSPHYIESIGTGVKVFKHKRDTFVGPTLVLNVEPYDMTKLTSVYEALMDEVRYALNHPLGSWVGEDYSDIPTPIRTLLWAEGPVAVPYQIEVIHDRERGFRFWPPAIVNTWENIVRHAAPEQIESVLEMARHPECVKDPDKEYSPHYTPGLAWAIHKWNTTAPESIKEKTRNLVGRFPDEDPCPQLMERGQWPYGEP